MKAYNMEQDVTNEVFNEVLAVFKKYGIEYGAVFYIQKGGQVKEKITVTEVFQDDVHDWVRKMSKILAKESKKYFNLDENGKPKELLIDSNGSV
jgi:hypothetical protein